MLKRLFPIVALNFETLIRKTYAELPLSLAVIEQLSAVATVESLQLPLLWTFHKYMQRCLIVSTVPFYAVLLASISL